MNDGEIVFRGKKIVGGIVEGRALVSRNTVCFLATLQTDGLVVERGHDLLGKNVKDRILVFPTGRGSTSGAYRLYDMALVGCAPKAILNIKADPVIISGAILGNIPMLHEIAPELIYKIETGDHVAVNADEGLIMVKKMVKKPNR